jgi:hypothetical protein
MPRLRLDKNVILREWSTHLIFTDDELDYEVEKTTCGEKRLLGLAIDD